MPHLLFLLLLSMASCATRDTPVVEEQSESIIENLSRAHDVLERFKVEEAKPVEVEEVRPVATSKPAKKSKTIAPPPPPTTPTQPAASESIVLPEEFDPEGEDYPEIFHTYDAHSKKVWESYRPIYFPNEEKVMTIRYLGLNAGQIRMRTRPLAKIDGREVMHYQANMRSARFYEYIYRLDDSVETYVDAQTQLPIRYTLIQRESGQDVDDLQVFDHENRKTYHWYKRIKDGRTKEEELEAFIPYYFQDSFSALAFARGLPYRVGDVYEYPIVTRTKLWLLRMEVERIEEIRVMGKRVSAYRIKAETRFPGVLERRGDILFWFSTDDERKLLRFRANVKIGAVEGELVEYTAGEKSE